MSYERSNLMLAGRRLTMQEAAKLTGRTATQISNRLSSGWTRRQVLGLDPPPGDDRDFHCDEILAACRKLEREHGERIADKALEGDVAALSTLQKQDVTTWDHCRTTLIGDPAHAAALRNRPTRTILCGCVVDAAAGITVLPCDEHKPEPVRRARRRVVERERALVATVNVVRGV